MRGEGFRVQSSGIPPFAKSAKDGAPERSFLGERKTQVVNGREKTTVIKREKEKQQ
jgi:hypothetical protein